MEYVPVETDLPLPQVTPPALNRTYLAGFSTEP